MSGALVALAERLQVACLRQGLTVALAESCTGGLIASTITAVPGSSSYFLGGVVAYANSAKADLLDVAEGMLATYGAVSAEVAAAMATGARARFGAALAISVTGIAGPDGGSEAKPVGLTYLGLAAGAGVEVRRLQLSAARAGNRDAAARAALEWLLEAGETGR